MPRSSKDIVKDLLKEANYYWYDDNEDNVNPINPDDFDPVVDKLFKANAVELEKLYAEIDESRRETILGLSKSMIPDQLLLPEPGYTIAQVQPKAQRVSTNPDDAFLIAGQSDIGERHEYYFTPIFEHHYPKCELAYIITDHVTIQCNKNTYEIVNGGDADKNTGAVWLGLKLGKVEEGDVISFFMGNEVMDEFDKDYRSFHSSKWLLNGDPNLELTIRNGVESFNHADNDFSENGDLLDTIGVTDSYEKKILTRFRNSFILLTLPQKPELYTVAEPSVDYDHLDGFEFKEPLFWIKIELDLAVRENFLMQNILYPNCIPLVNRRKKEKSIVKSNYDRILLPMPTKDLFLDVYKIQDTQNKEDEPETGYQRIDFLHPDSPPGTFMLRGGSRVRRLNREDATRRIARLLEIIQDEYSTFKEEGVNRLKEDFDVIEKAVNRIKKNLPDFFREDEKKASYFCIANFRPSVSRLYYSYWETQGDLIQHLGSKTALEVSSSDIKIEDCKTIIPIQKGKGELTSDDYINQLKISLLSRGRIMSKGDIERYCINRYRKTLKVIDISQQLMVFEEGKISKGIVVTVVPAKPLTEAEAGYVRVELQNDLNAKSAFFTQIKVAIKNEG